MGGGCNSKPSTIIINEGTVKAQGGARGGAGIGTGSDGDWKADISLTINGGDITAIGGEAAEDGYTEFFTGAAIGGAGDNYMIGPDEWLWSRFYGSINLNGGTIHASYAGENKFGVILIGCDENKNSRINIKANCKIYVDKGNNNSDVSPMDAETIDFENVTEGSTVYSSKVYNIDNTSDIALAADRVAWCKAENDNKSIAIVPCDHAGATYTAKDDRLHTKTCLYCTGAASVEEAHTYGDPVYTWTADASQVTASRTCTACSHENSVTVNTTSEITRAATCTEPGERTYTAAFSDPFTVQTKTESVAIDVNVHDWGNPTYTWNDDLTKVTAARVCKNDSAHSETETVDVTSAVTKVATEQEDGVETYTSKAFANPAFAVQTRTKSIDRLDHKHKWGTPTYTWLNDNHSVTATRICQDNTSHVETETATVISEVTTPAACETKGKTTYTATFQNTAFVSQTTTLEDVPAIGHEWNATVYEWADDNSRVTAKRTCKHDGNHVETETANVNSEETKPAACEAMGETTYTATFQNTAFLSQTKTLKDIAAIGHDWSEPVYEWAGDNSRVTAKRICTKNDSHVETETVGATSSVTTNATCESKEAATYTSEAFKNEAFTIQTKQADIGATGHDWGNPTYTWKDDLTEVMAVRVCKNDPDHTETETVGVTSFVTKNASCEEKGKRTYISAAFTNTAFSVQIKSVEDIDATGHDWGAPTFTWSDDRTKATVTRVCSNDASHVETATVTVNNRTYDGTEKPLVLVDGSAQLGSEMRYALGENATAAPADDLYTTDIPAKTDAGTYYVWYKVVGDANHANSEPKSISVEIAQVNLTITAKDQTVKAGESVATGKDQVEVAGLLDGHVLDMVSVAAGTENDAAKVIASGAKVKNGNNEDVTANYNISYQPGTLTVRMAISQTVTFKVVNGSWDDGTTTDKPVTLTGYEGDTLKLAANQIPAVGSKPNDTYKAGSWDVTLGTETAITEATTYTYTYAKKDAATVTTAPTAKTLTYTGSAQELVTAGEAEGGEMQYALGTATEATQPYITSIPTATDAGTYYVWYKVVEDGNHTDVSPVSVTVHIYTSGAYVSKAPTAKYLFYTGEAQELVEAGTAGGGTMRYALGTDTEMVPQEFTYTLPTGTEAGTYYVWYKASGDWNHYDTAAACITVTIYPAGDDEESMPHYDGTPQPLVKPGTIEGGTIEYALGTSDQEAPTEGWSEEIPTGVNPGEYYVWYRIKGDANHKDVAPACVKVTLGKAFIDPVVSLTGWTYGQEANEPSVEENTGKGTVEYLYSSEEEGEYTKEVPVNAGTYYVKASVAETEYYRAGVSKPLSFAISKASINIQAVNKTSKLGGKLKKLTYKVTGDYVLGDKLGIKLKTTAKKAKAGKYKITVSWNKNPNYQAKLIKGTYTVKDRITKAEKKAAKAKLNKGLKGKAKGNKLTVQWGAVSKAGRYEVWAAYKGSKAYRKVGTVKGSVRKLTFSKLNGKKLNLKKGVNVYVKVYRKVNKKMALITKSKVKTIKR